MDRRTFLHGLGGVTAAGLSAPELEDFSAGVRPLNRTAARGTRQGQRRPHVVVAGAGIIGASIAYHLAARGAQVTVLEKARPAAGATANSFAWLNATYSKQPWHYHLIHRFSLDGWRELQRQWNGELQVEWGGSLEWHPDAERGARLRDEVRSHLRWGYAVELVDERRFRGLEPDVRPGPIAAAAWCRHEGSVDPVHAVEVFLRKAEERGVQVFYPAEITGIDVRDGRLRAVQSSTGEVACDVLVVSCGVDTPALAAMAGFQVPLVDSPGMLAHTKPQSRLINRTVLAPGAHMIQRTNGSVVTGAGFGGSPTTDNSPEMGRRILGEAGRFLPALEGAELDRVTLGWRPMPEDGFPIVGFPEGSPGVYLAVMHSGMSLAPIIGRLAATEILDDVDVELLEPFRLSRF